MGARIWAQHIFHVQGVGSQIHDTGSGDTAISWICTWYFVGVRLLRGRVVEPASIGRRPHYQTLSAWLRFTIRLTLGIGMISYGVAKLLPMQMQPPGSRTE